MRVELRHWNAHTGWQCAAPISGIRPQLVLVFGDQGEPTRSALLQDLRQFYPHAAIVGCSSAGEIWDDLAHTDSFCVTAIEFSDTRVIVRSVSLNDIPDCTRAGEKLGAALPRKDLRHCLLFSDGLHVQINAVINGLYSALPAAVCVTGGLAGDGPRFGCTWVYAEDRYEPDRIVVVGLYGAHINICSGSVGGWQPFGPDRIITRSQGNVLYELDNQPALALYERYLGSYAPDLPASGLLFPLSLRVNPEGPGLVRTILGFNRDDQSLTFGGEMPAGCSASLMEADFSRLVDGAMQAALCASFGVSRDKPSLAILISCVGRRLVLHQHIDDEIDAVRQVLGPSAALTGFYSYGEIAPMKHGDRCQLHNQTMTITTLQEV